jgi:hemolysin III
VAGGTFRPRVDGPYTPIHVSRGSCVSASPISVSPVPRARPLLRGWSHAIAAFGAVALTVALVVRCLGDGPRLMSMLLYGLASVGLFSCSAVYHVVTWTPSRRKIMRALDHGNIYVMIASTTTAIGLNVLHGWERIALLSSVWVIALIGICVSVFHVRFSRGPRLALYIGTGLTGLIALPGLLEALPPLAIGLLVGGGLVYAMGGLIYATKRPNPFPRVFGYHEIFHLLVIAGAMAFAAVIWFWVVPFPRA